MLLYYDEFCNNGNNIKYIKYLNYYDKLQDELHLMSAEEIIKHIKRYGYSSVYIQKSAVLQYLRWLHLVKGIDVSEKIYEILKSLKINSSDYLGFLDLEDLKNGINEAIEMIEISTDRYSNSDYDGLFVTYYLEWYGVLPKSSISIELTDVHDFGKKIYIPAEDRIVNITDEAVADFIWEYRNKKGIYTSTGRFKSYVGNTLYRTCKSGTKAERKVYNARCKFVNICQDDRFAKKHVYLSGRYYEMLQRELQGKIIFALKRIENADKKQYKILQEIFNSPDTSNYTKTSWIVKYLKYKKAYLNNNSKE